jgi:hypothetical protein
MLNLATIRLLSSLRGSMQPIDIGFTSQLLKPADIARHLVKVVCWDCERVIRVVWAPNDEWVKANCASTRLYGTLPLIRDYQSCSKCNLWADLEDLLSES